MAVKSSAIFISKGLESHDVGLANVEYPGEWDMVSPQFQIFSKPNIHQEGTQGGLIMYLHEVIPTSPDVESLGQGAVQ